MSCLFNSLARFVPDITGESLRKTICDYLATNPKLMSDDTEIATIIFAETGLAADTYIGLMRNPSTFGGAIEIRAFSKIYSLNVFVNSVPNNKKIEFIENSDYRWCALEWTGNHYEACRNI